MALLLIAIIAALAIVLFLAIRKKNPLTRNEPPIRANLRQSTQEEGNSTEYGILATAEQIHIEQQSKEEIMSLLEVAIIDSGYFIPAKIPDLVAKLRAGSSLFGRTNTRVAFDGDVMLTVEDKRALGLNTRMKYSKSFIDYFDPAALKIIEPKMTLENMHLDAFHRVSRRNDLLKFKELGFVRQVKIVPTGDAGDCSKIMRFKKTHDICEVPELPLPGCTSPYCRCMYEPVIPRDI